MTAPDGTTPTRQRPRTNHVLALIAPALLCFLVVGIGFRSGDSGEGSDWPFVAGVATGALVAGLLLLLGARRLAAARRARQDAATLDALEPLGPAAPRGEQR
ncbi:hypothetical protein [Kineococcus sp. SYSU DK002]|uniref:hypothetical protein n=1 Tax=Kineococcus sp. SYSU DK002 TaxID=3383123 RepID=UPI003D7DAEE5